MTPSAQPLVYLLILDGFGLGDGGPADATAAAEMPYLRMLLSMHSMARLATHGAAVGLPAGQTGGSEMGHITLGSGRAVKTILAQIDDAIADGSLLHNPALQAVIAQAKTTGRLHLIGMVSDGGIHSYSPHLHSLIALATAAGIPHIYLHAITDGRDVAERSAREYIEPFLAEGVTLASIGGRYYAMDRDHNWDRTEASYRVLMDVTAPTLPEGTPWQQALEHHYTTAPEEQSSDYYLPPVVLDHAGQLRPGDGVICWNFRTDRMRQLMAALADEEFSHFARPWRVEPQHIAVFGNYYPAAREAFSMQQGPLIHTLGQVVAAAGLTQLRVAETDKYNHVTFFFNGENPEPFPQEDRLLIPSPKVPSYSSTPKMSAVKMTTEVLARLQQTPYNLVVHNYANPDLVGHGGDFSAVVAALECVDECLSRLIPQVTDRGYSVIITADHGNCEHMTNPDGTQDPSHTQNLVPCIIVSNRHQYTLRPQGTLQDVAPTVLSLLHLPVPAEMTGQSLITD